MGDADMLALMYYKEKLNAYMESPVNREEELRSVFYNFTELLKQSIYHPSVIKVERSCKVCQGPKTLLAYCLPCKHLICSSECYNQLVLNCKDLRDPSSLICPCGVSFKKIVCYACNIACSEVTRFECGHSYCQNCIKRNLRPLSNEERPANEIKCYKCNPLKFPR